MSKSSCSVQLMKLTKRVSSERMLAEVAMTLMYMSRVVPAPIFVVKSLL